MWRWTLCLILRDEPGRSGRSGALVHSEPGRSLSRGSCGENTDPNVLERQAGTQPVKGLRRPKTVCHGFISRSARTAAGKDHTSPDKGRVFRTTKLGSKGSRSPLPYAGVKEKPINAKTGWTAGSNHQSVTNKFARIEHSSCLHKNGDSVAT